MSHTPTAPGAGGPSWPPGRRGSRGPTRGPARPAAAPEDRLIARFRTLPAGSDDKVRIVAALAEAATATPAVAAFLASVLADPDEDGPARVECATALRLHSPGGPAARRAVAAALLAALADPDDDLLRRHAATALGPYADDPAVDRALIAAVTRDDDPRVRGNALAALQDAGPSPERIDVLTALTQDATLGGEAARILGKWGTC
ncbi:HEAT repeat domain-containing protein [Kitasatospora sp. RG8]|uniref:HEAT repeat domain-containing protein n=1 Tax=Kitasatospora sp. RG8 TaxID=2820815 RepID=UPI001ADF04C3|nr:HEAT repeat domain-containing protein [Kitasatospora sp. RG8]MBP0452136.1 HEAT repeat domain-containing protein [Kitasatospora sp. RG8]